MFNKQPQTRTQHGLALTDEWAWLRADNWQEVLTDPTTLPPEIRTHLENENALAEDYFAPLASLHAELETEIKGRITEDEAGVPYQWGDYAYSWRYPKGANYRVWYRADSTGAETILLDENALAADHTYFKLGDYKISPDHTQLAYTVDTQGSEFYTLYLKNLTTGDTQKLLDTIIEDVEWSADTTALLAVTLTPEHKPEAVIAINITTKARRTVFVEADKSLFVHLGKTDDNAFITITSSDYSLNEIQLIPANNITAAPICALPRQPDVRYSVSHWENSLYLLTNDGAPDGKILTAPTQDILAGKATWQDVIPHQAGTLIEEMHLQAGHIIRMTMHNAQPEIHIFNLAEKTSRTLTFNTDVYDISFIPQYDASLPQLRFQYSTPVQPAQIWEEDLINQERTLLKETKIPSAHNADDYIVERLFVTASDGAKIPVTRWAHKNTDIKTAPTLQYAYGSYGISMPVTFRHTVISLLNRGFVYAIAHIRGGKECGEEWYQNGKLQNKNNTFSDFTAVADFFQSEAGQPRFIAAQGGSAGGMLMGVLANENPASVSAIIAQVPFVDVLNTISDDTLPLTPPEWNEWGNPITNKANFDNMAAYCPYQNVSTQDYPAIFALAGLSDPRVTYWEPAKWIARIRTHRTNEAQLLLSTDMTSGHGGASGRYGYLSEIAKIQTFVLNEYQQFKEDKNDG